MGLGLFPWKHRQKSSSREPGKSTAASGHAQPCQLMSATSSRWGSGHPERRGR